MTANPSLVSPTKVLTALLVLSLATIAPALAQDVIGVQPISTAVLFAMRIIATIALCWGMMCFMRGGHGIQAALFTLVGVAGVAKTPAIAAFLGLGG